VTGLNRHRPYALEAGIRDGVDRPADYRAGSSGDWKSLRCLPLLRIPVNRIDRARRADEQYGSTPSRIRCRSAGTVACSRRFQSREPGVDGSAHESLPVPCGRRPPKLRTPGVAAWRIGILRLRAPGGLRLPCTKGITVPSRHTSKAGRLTSTTGSARSAASTQRRALLLRAGLGRYCDKMGLARRGSTDDQFGV